MTLEGFKCIDSGVEAFGVERSKTFINEERINKALTSFKTREGKRERTLPDVEVIYTRFVVEAG